ncbi:hypothetical protein O6H91_02G032400 [Diphasiastrum complanatum]|uniref:Uncharacterized protein n=2 Tax=Diphasiastrum complanatum TaxID=34168 RepID=A0ACC2BER4_DIPCM|nr:hypothetical protein O6H91_16G087600 [Diphasiastrum complanatum]KAJ7564763.1 hypothetical protein O6H91_02G032400 [Diphasiastrum complanatum]
MAKEETKSEKKSETVVLKVEIHCNECLRKIQRAITKIDGVESINYDLKEKKVTLSGKINPQNVLKTVKKTGKQVQMLQPKETKEADKKDSEKKESGSKESGKKDSDKKDAPGKAGEDSKKLLYSYPSNDLTYMFSEENPSNVTCSIM